jgi:Tudor domain
VTLMLTQSEESGRLAAFCHLQEEEDQAAVNYLLETLQTEFEAQPRLDPDASLVVGSPVVVKSDVDQTCYRGLVLTQNAAGMSVLLMDFGNILQASRKKVVPMWPAASDWKSFGLQLSGEKVAGLETVLGTPVKAFVEPSTTGAVCAVKIPALENHIFDVFPWFSIRYG